MVRKPRPRVTSWVTPSLRPAPATPGPGAGAGGRPGGGGGGGWGAAAVDAGPADGVAAARGALAGGLGRLGRGLSVQGSGDGETVEVVVTGTVPGLGLVPDLPVTARSRARDEDAVLPGGLP